jgi:hypothetical protein
MKENRKLSSIPSLLIGLTAAAFALIGLSLFVWPDWSAANFPWKISPLVARAMGGWYLGSAVMAGLVAYHRRWNLVYPSTLYVGVFTVAEALVLVIHRSKLQLGAALAWPYIGMLALGTLAGIFALFEWTGRRPAGSEEGPFSPRWAHTVIISFILFVFFIAGFAFSGHWIGLSGIIFPEPLTLFTLHSFGAFYFSLAFSALALLRERRSPPIIVHACGGLALILFITVAGFIHIGSFNFGEHPFQTIYLGVYLLALIVVIYYLWIEGFRANASASN